MSSPTPTNDHPQPLRVPEPPASGGNPAVALAPRAPQPGSFNVYAAPIRPTPERFQPDSADLALALTLGVLGYLCWEWHVPLAALGASLFYLGCLAATFVYLAHKGVRQDARSLVLLAIAIAGALRFALMDVRAIDLVMHAAQVSVCLLWVAYSCRTISSRRWDGFVLADWFRQVFAVPFANFGRWFQSLGWALRSRSRVRSILFLVGGVVVCLPVFALVMMLLARSDDSFTNFLNWFAQVTVFDSVGRYVLQLIFAVPVAAYVFGAVVGNQRHRHADVSTKQRTQALLRRAHVINRAGLYGPLAVLTVIYLLYFGVMGSYLFSALTGVLPGGFSYAEYARRGFFELCGVATINLIALTVTYLFARRGEGERPRALRILGGTISAFTCLLVVTAMSKLLLYIGTYGLSELRLYSLWFLVVLLTVFATLVVWHLHAFDAGRLIAWIAAGAIALLCFANTDGIIADYNVNQYLDGASAGARIDLGTIASLNDAAAPALRELADHAPDPQIRSHAAAIIAERVSLADQDTFADWNLQSHMLS